MFDFLLAKKKYNSKVIFVSPDINSGGAENILFNIAKNINIEDIIIISLTDNGFYGSKLQEKGYKIYTLNMKKNFLFLFKFIRLIILINKFRPKYVHTWLYHANLIGGIAAKIAGVKKLIWTIHHDFEYSSFLGFVEMKILIILSYFLPDKIIYGSEISRFNHESNGFIKIKSITINNGVCLDKFKPIPKFRKYFRNKFKINKDTLLLGNIARYHPLKDHETLLKTLEILKNENIDFKCIFIGPGLSKNNHILKNKIKKYGLSKKIILYGKTYEINKVINSFDINILTSIKECSPISIMESMSVGIPCISTDVGNASTLLRKSGWVFPIYDYISIASCIKDIANNKKILIKKGKLSRKIIEQNYPLRKMIYEYKNLYI